MPGSCEDVDAIATAVGLPSSEYPVNTYVGGVDTDLMGDLVQMRLGTFDVNTDLLQTIPGGRTSSSIVSTRADGSRPVLHLKGETGSFYIEQDQFEKVTDVDIVHFGGVGLMSCMNTGQNARLAK